MNSAPRNAKWLILLLNNGTTVRAHYAEDLSGEDQPPFRGWFEEMGSHGFSEVSGDPIGWKPEPAGESNTEGKP
jgi:hypothetical protein